MKQKLIITMSLLCCAGLVSQVVAQDATADAAQRHKALVDAANQAKQNMLSLKPTPPVSVVNEHERLKILAKDVAFSVRPAYHSWPSRPEFHSEQDYTIVMSYFNPEHIEKFEAQTDEWLKQGWFISRSELVENKVQPEIKTTMKVRIVR